MIQEHETYDLVLGVYLCLEGCRISKFSQSEYKGKLRLQIKIINDDPDKDIDELVKHYKEDLAPFIPGPKRRIVDVGAGDVNFERGLLTAIFGRVD